MVTQGGVIAPAGGAPGMAAAVADSNVAPRVAVAQVVREHFPHPHPHPQLDAMTPHVDDESRLIAIARQGREQLERQWAQERQAQAVKGARGGWEGEGPDR